MAEASIPEQLAEQVKLALLASPQIDGIDARVYRAREDTIERSEGDTINVKSESEALQPVSDEVDDSELILSVQIYVTGDVWETKADAYAIQAHRRILAWDYAGAGLRLMRVRRSDGDWTGDQGDEPPGRRSLKFGFRYFALASDMTRQP